MHSLEPELVEGIWLRIQWLTHPAAFIEKAILVIAREVRNLLLGQPVRAIILMLHLGLAPMLHLGLAPTRGRLVDLKCVLVWCVVRVDRTRKGDERRVDCAWVTRNLCASYGSSFPPSLFFLPLFLICLVMITITSFM